MNGILNILKPAGMSSSEVVSRLKHTIGEKKVGHIGTLDPAAAGVLPVMLGKATKLFDLLSDHTKEYICQFDLGVETDTLDAEGQITRQMPVDVTEAQVREALAAMTGELVQTPPMYSAMVYQGKKLYDWAREGKEVPIKQRTVTIYEADLLEMVDERRFMVRIACSKGTYIRSYCRDLAEKLGTCGHVSVLIRSRTGEFEAAEAMTLAEAGALHAQGVLADKVLPMDRAVRSLPEVQVRTRYEKPLTNGLPVPYDGEPFDGLGRIFCHSRFVGLGKYREETGQVKVTLYLLEDR